jgi:transcriptional regulator with XRE-family HTH domain
MNRTDKHFLQQVGDRIRERRMAMNLTQAALAEKCGLHRTFIGSVERGERNVALLSLRRIAVALRRRPEELLAASDTESRGKKRPQGEYSRSTAPKV